MPNQLFWLTLLLGAFFIFLPVSPSFADPGALTLHQVITSLDSTSPVLANARAELALARAAYTSSRAFPNPALFGSQESLDDAEGTTESVIGVRQHLGFLWSQPSRRAATMAQYDAAQLTYVEARRELVVRVIHQAYECDRLRRQSRLMDTVLVQTEQLSRAATARLKVGDIAPYDEQRFLLEQLQLQHRKQALSGQLVVAMAEFVQLTGLPAEEISNVELMMPPAAPFASEDEALRTAVNQRPALRGATMQLEAARHALSQSRWNQLPDFSLGFGNKMVDPGPGGLYVEGELEIPLWNQRRSERNVASAEYAQTEYRSKSNRRLIEHEVRSAYRQFQLVNRLQPPADISLADSAIMNMGRGVRLYLEGELSALELVDALRTGIEAQDAALSLRNSLAVARADLRRVCGLEPLEQ